MNTRFFKYLLFFSYFVLSHSVYAQDGDGKKEGDREIRDRDEKRERDRPPERKRRAEDREREADERQAMQQRAKEIWAKRKAGKELNEDERALLERVMRQKEPFEAGGRKPKGPPWVRREEGERNPGRPQGPNPIQIFISEINVVDRAALTAAQTLFELERREQALEAAAKVIEKSPDKEAVALARLLAGRFHMRMEQPEKGRALLLQVTGRPAVFALHALLGPLIRGQEAGEDQGEGAAKQILEAYKKMLSHQPEGLDRARLLQALVEGLSRPGISPELKAKVLGAVGETVKYDDALAAREALAKERKAFQDREQMARRMGPDRERGDRGRPEDDIKRRLKDMGDMPQGHRKKMLANMRAQLENRLKELGDAGPAEERENLQKALQRLEKHAKKLGKRGKEKDKKKGDEKDGGVGQVNEEF